VQALGQWVFEHKVQIESARTQFDRRGEAD
jgi:hypothetical protein